MSRSRRPSGYHTVTPSIIVRDAAAAIDFYVRAFGAEEITRLPGPDGSIMHAEIQIGDSRIMLGEENPAWGAKSPQTLGGAPSSLHIYVDDADAAFARAVKEGATVRYPLEDTFWGDRYAKIVDPFGHEWGVAHQIREMSEAEVQAAGQEWMAKMSAGGGMGGATNG